MEIRLETTQVLEAADRLLRLDIGALAELRRATADSVAESTRAKAIHETHRQLNLTRDYIESRIAREEARMAGSAASAIVRSQIRGATLQRFGISQETRPVNWTNERIESLGIEFGPWPGWTKRVGDVSRGIPVNLKAAGISVDVNRKGAKTIVSAFTMPLRNGNGVGVFRRESGSLRHLYGPSVYQTFRRYIAENEESIFNDLRATFMRGLDAAISGL